MSYLLLHSGQVAFCLKLCDNMEPLSVSPSREEAAYFTCSQSLLVRPRQIEVPFMSKVWFVWAPNYESSKIYTAGMQQYHRFYGDNISNSIFLQVWSGVTFALSMSVATLEAAKEKMSVKFLRWRLSFLFLNKEKSVLKHFTVKWDWIQKEQKVADRDQRGDTTLKPIHAADSVLHVTMF